MRERIWSHVSNKELTNGIYFFKTSKDSTTKENNQPDSKLGTGLKWPHFQRYRSGQQAHEKMLGILVIREHKGKPQWDATSQPPGWRLSGTTSVGEDAEELEPCGCLEGNTVQPLRTSQRYRKTLITEWLWFSNPVSGETPARSESTVSKTHLQHPHSQQRPSQQVRKMRKQPTLGSFSGWTRCGLYRQRNALQPSKRTSWHVLQRVWTPRTWCPVTSASHKKTEAGRWFHLYEVLRVVKIVATGGSLVAASGMGSVYRV